MKKISIFLFTGLMTLSFLATSQEFNKPKSGAKIEMTETTLALNPGSETSFDVWINRSKRARKAKFNEPQLKTKSCSSNFNHFPNFGYPKIYFLNFYLFFLKIVRHP